MKFNPIGKWIEVKTDMGGQKTTDAGVIYTDKPTGRYVKSEVVAVGSGVAEDVQVGDIVYWDSKEFKGDEYGGNHLVNEKWIALVERN
jgi:co-chaperonin GroES (HSP10)